MSDLRAIAYVNHGFWVARCPVPYCRGAEHYGWREGGGGMEPGRLTEEWFSCKGLTCGWSGPAVWPVERAEIERLLMQRPDPVRRNWVPGELLTDLLRENIAHGLYPPAVLEVLSQPIEVGAGGPPRVSEDLSIGEITSILGVGQRALTGGH